MLPLLVAALLSSASAVFIQPVEGEITYVYVQILFNSVGKIDGPEESFNTDFYFSMYWWDPQAAAAAADPSFDPNTYDPTVPGSVFDPTVNFENVLGDPTLFYERDQEYFYVDNTPYDNVSYPIMDMLTFWGDDVDNCPHCSEIGWLGFQQRYQANYFAKLDLHEFPYDIQSATLRLDSLQWDATQVQFLPLTPKSSFIETMTSNSSYGEFQVIGWDFKGGDIQFGQRYFPVYETSYSTFIVSINLKRDPTYYLYKLVGGSILLVYMSLVFFVLVAEDANRMMGTLTVFLALISFVFVAGGDLPKIPYQTRIDNFFSWSFFIVFFEMLLNAVMYMYRADDDEDDVLAEAAGVSLEMKAYLDKPQPKPSHSAPHTNMPHIEPKKNAIGLMSWKQLGWQRRGDIIVFWLAFITYNIGVVSILGRVVPLNYQTDSNIVPYCPHPQVNVTDLVVLPDYCL
jgi:hypothetical protein